MGKVVTIAAAIVILTASWVCAGGFQTLADAAAVRPLTPLYIQPGTLQKVEFPSNLRTNSDIETESDAPIAEPVAASSGPQVKPRPAVAFRERPAAAMAPPPRMTSDSDQSMGTVAEHRDDSSSLEDDLEKDLGKDLVIPPPSPRTEEKNVTEPKPVVETKPAQEKTAVSGMKGEKKKASTQMRKPPSPDQVHYATSGKPIRKVRPLSQSQWNVPAGAHDARAGRPVAARTPRHDRARMGNRPMEAPEGPDQYMASAPRRSINPPPTADRFVRDGVTIKLAPGTPGSMYPDEYRDDSSGSDILSAAAEIIGLPFAFISSLF